MRPNPIPNTFWGGFSFRGGALFENCLFHVCQNKKLGISAHRIPLFPKHCAFTLISQICPFQQCGAKTHHKDNQMNWELKNELSALAWANQGIFTVRWKRFTSLGFVFPFLFFFSYSALGVGLQSTPWLR